MLCILVVFCLFVSWLIFFFLELLGCARFAFHVVNLQENKR